MNIDQTNLEIQVNNEIHKTALVQALSMVDDVEAQLYAENGMDYEKPVAIAAGPKDVKYVLCGCASAMVEVLKEDETFDENVGFDNIKGLKIEKGTHVQAIEDIKPFSYSEYIEDERKRNLAKAIMTRDFLRTFWKAQEIDSDLEVVYGYTNPEMAAFKCKHWGFKVLGDENTEEALKSTTENLVVYANAKDIEEKYEHLIGYVDELIERVNNPR